MNSTTSMSTAPECALCFTRINTPKILTCGHTFCLNCIIGHIANKTLTFSCPVCQQDVRIPEGGAQAFTTNFMIMDIMSNNAEGTSASLPGQTNQPGDQPGDKIGDQPGNQLEPQPTTNPKCPNHKQDEVELYCNNCNEGLCLKCILIKHEDRETLDIESDETRKQAIEKLERSKQITQNRIKHLEKTRSTLLESFEQLKSLCEDSCAKVTEATEQMVSDLRKRCEQIITDIRKQLEENRSKVEDREKEITSEINVLESDMESNISPSTKTTLNILLTLPGLIEIEKLDESKKDYNLCLQYLQWVGKDFSLDIDQLGSVISKPFYIPGSYQFLFNVSYIENSFNTYNSKKKFRYNNLVWSCSVMRDNDDDLHIGIKLLPDDNPKLDYYIIDSQLSLLNFDDDSKTMTITDSEKKLKRGGLWAWRPINLHKLTDKNNGFSNHYGQFIIQFDIKQIREIEFSQ